MSYEQPSNRIGGSAFNHQQSSSAEAEYEKLRDLARQEQGKHQHCAAESRQAYERGDGAGAKQLSDEGKQHAQQADNYNHQASDYIFRENNAVGRVDSDTIDLHGQFVVEAEEIVTQRIKYAQSTGQKHLHVIVGKGNHSVDHIQKIKPAVENICQELGLQYSTEHNEGRMYIDLTGGQANPPANYGGSGQYDQQSHGQPQYQTAYPLGGKPQYNAWQQQGGYNGQQQQQQQPQQYGQPQQYNGAQQQYNGAQQQYNGSQQYGQQQQYNGQQQYGNQQQYGQQQQYSQQQQQPQTNTNNTQQFDYQAEFKKDLPIIMRLVKSCCTVM